MGQLNLKELDDNEVIAQAKSSLMISDFGRPRQR